MTRLQKLQLRQSEARQKLGELLDVEQRSDSHDEDTKKLTNELRALETDIQGAILAEPEATTTETVDGDMEGRERRELRERSEVRSYLTSAATGATLTGAEAEYRAAVFGDESRDDLMPLDLLLDPDEELERRTDDATTVSTAVPTTQRSISGRVFARSDASYLGAQFVDVGIGETSWPYISAGTSAGTYAEGAVVEADAATISVASASPTRASARYKFAIESAARIQGMESALRADLRATLSDGLDNQVLNGSGTAPAVSGVLNRLTAPTAPTNTATAIDYLAAYSDSVDGKLAVTSSEVRLLAGVATYKQAAKLGFTGSGELLETVLERVGPGRFRASSRIPAAVSNIQHAVIYRYARGGGNAYVPTWGGVSIIRDPYTESSSGRVALSAHLLFNFVVKDLSSWTQASFKLA